MQFSVIRPCTFAEGMLIGEKPNEKSLNNDKLTDSFGGDLYFSEARKNVQTLNERENVSFFEGNYLYIPL